MVLHVSLDNTVVVVLLVHVVAKRTSDFSKRDFAVEQDFVSTLRDTTFPATIKPRRRHNANASISPHAHDEIAAAIYTYIYHIGSFRNERAVGPREDWRRSKVEGDSAKSPRTNG